MKKKNDKLSCHFNFKTQIIATFRKLLFCMFLFREIAQRKVREDSISQPTPKELNPFLSIKKSGLDILLTGYNNLTLQTY